MSEPAQTGSSPADSRGRPRPVVVDRPEYEVETLDLGESAALPARVRDRIMGEALAVKDPEQHFIQQQRLAAQLQPTAIRMTKPQDWVRMGDTVYLQGSGAERFINLYGLILGQPTTEREDYPDGTYAYIVSGGGMSTVLRTIIGRIEGARWSGDSFFDQFDMPVPKRAYREGDGGLDDEALAAWKREHRIPPNPTDVRKAAFTNWEIRLISRLTGMRGLSEADLEACGMKAGRGVTFKTGEKGGKSANVSATGEAIVPFTKHKGKRVSELTDKQLAWFIETTEKDMGPGGPYAPGGKYERYRPERQAFLIACQKEAQERAEIVAGERAEAAGGAPAASEPGPPDA